MSATLLVDLQDVATYWKQRNLVREDQIPFYVRWLQRFLVGPGADPRLSPQDAQRIFVEQLERTGQVQGWLVRQAARAVELYQKHYPKAAWEWGWQYVFPARDRSIDPRSGAVRRHHIDAQVLKRLMREAVVRAGIVKHAGVHTLRHSFATSLLMRGVNIREVQEYLGHKSVETTMIYTHVMRGLNSTAVSPLDALEKGRG